MSSENAAAMSELDAMIAKISALPDLAVMAAPRIAEVMRRDIEGTIDRAMSSEGEPWKPTAEGQKPLQHAAKALRVAAIGPVIYARLTGVEARHHLGRVRGGVKRSIIPTQGLPPRMAAEVQVVLEQTFSEVMR